MYILSNYAYFSFQKGFTFTFNSEQIFDHSIVHSLHEVDFFKFFALVIDEFMSVFDRKVISLEDNCSTNIFVTSPSVYPDFRLRAATNNLMSQRIKSLSCLSFSPLLKFQRYLANILKSGSYRQSSGSRQAVVRQSSGSLQAVVRQSSGKSSGSGLAVIKWYIITK